MPYADVNGLHLFYEQLGEGPPLVLLQGHGRTADIDRPGATVDAGRLRRHARRLRRGGTRSGPFRGVREEAAAMVPGFDGWSDDQVRGIEAPVLVLVGDTDFILVPDAAHAAELLPSGPLAVLPGTTHMDLTRSELVAPIVDTFLAPADQGPQNEKKAC